jgi:RNA polymerase subunit RPABC4/transcription elongation factor Spt4
MKENVRTEGHLTERGIYCPNCGQKDTIEYWKAGGSNVNLLGQKIDNMERIKPTCRNCKRVYSKGTLFLKHR